MIVDIAAAVLILIMGVLLFRAWSELGVRTTQRDDAEYRAKQAETAAARLVDRLAEKAREVEVLSTPTLPKIASAPPAPKRKPK